MYSHHTLADPRRKEVSDLVQIGRLSWASVRRHSGLILGMTVLCLGLAALYLFWRPESYTASSRILVDNRVLALEQQDAIYSVSSLSSQLMDSQVEILRSDNIARDVIGEQKLLANPDFGAGASSRPEPPAAPVAAGDGDVMLPAPDDSTAMRRALKIFQSRLAVDQVGQSYVIEIRMTTSDPQLAAQITNSLVEAYLRDQSAANARAAQSASGWLRSRLQSLGTTARVLTTATAPLESDGPRAAIILGFALFCGLVSGTGLAFARDLFDQRLRGRAAVQEACGAECFGFLPEIKPATRSLFRGWSRKRREVSGEQIGGVVAKSEPLDWAIERPRSLFAHTLRRARAALFGERASAPLTIGVTSIRPGEGKTTVAANFARLAALWGKKVLLIDGVPYNARLTKLLGPQANFGLRDAFRGKPLDQILLADRWTAMHFLPGATGEGEATDAGLISRSTERFLAQLKTHYDLIVIDLPPLSPVSDVHELAHLLDRILLVVEWGRYGEDELAKALEQSGGIRKKLIGAVLNKADPGELRKYAEDADAIGATALADYVDDQERRPLDARPARVPQSEAAPVPSEATGMHLRDIRKARAENGSFEEKAETNA